MTAVLRSLLLLILLAPVAAQAAESPRPYDDKLLRLSEILGAVHFLRELCGAEEGQQWRQQMTELINADSSSAERKSRLTSSFNKGYRGYRRTYQVCNESAKSQLTRFLTEGADIAKVLAEEKP